MGKKEIILVKGLQIATLKIGKEDYISITDIARNKNPDEPKDVVKNWMRSRNVIEFEAGSNSFTLSPSKWIDSTNAIGIISKVGKNGGTFAQKDIAFEFASWVSSGFKLYLIKEFQRLKEDENIRLKLEWNLQRTLAKVNYHIHTDAIKEKLIPPTITKIQASYTYAIEADMLNVALFGVTAKEWREVNPELEGNIRDHATIEQLVVLSNLESVNAVLILQGLSQHKRLLQLNQIAINQMKSLVNAKAIKKLNI